MTLAPKRHEAKRLIEGLEAYSLEFFYPYEVAAAYAAGGGHSPRWNPAGRELFYLANDGHFVAVPIRTTPVLELGTPATLFAVSERASLGRLRRVA